MENQMGENHRMFSYISKYYFHKKHQLPNYLAPTGRRIQPEGSYNSLDSPTPTRRRLQPPDLQAPT